MGTARVKEEEETDTRMVRNLEETWARMVSLKQGRTTAEDLTLDPQGTRVSLP